MAMEKALNEEKYHQDTQKEPCEIKIHVEVSITNSNFAFLAYFWQCCTKNG